MRANHIRWLEGTLLVTAMAAGAAAQTPGPVTARPGFPGAQRGIVVGRQGPGSMGGVFSFVEPVGENSAVVQGEPFTAEISRESIQQLPDGNVIDRKSTGMIARDAEGRTRREMTLENIGPLAAEGKVPHLVIINDPVSGKAYTLNEDSKTAIEMVQTRRRSWRGKRHTASLPEFQSETATESLGEKTMDGVLVQGTRTTRTIPAGQIGNEKPLVITSERWYSPDLQTVVRLTRNDPRFGTTTYELTNISQSVPDQSLFRVPSGYKVTKGGRFMIQDGQGDANNPRLPLR